MKLSGRDKRALAALGVMATITLAVVLWPEPGTETPGPDTMATPRASIPMAEARLARLREMVASLPGRQKRLHDIQAQVNQRERGMLAGETAAQAQAQLMQTMRRLAKEQAPPVEVRQLEMGAVQGLGKDYGEALVTLAMTCRIEQLVNLLADITAQPELIATSELNVGAGDAKQKTLNVRLTVSGVIPRNLVPERRVLGL